LLAGAKIHSFFVPANTNYKIIQDISTLLELRRQV